MLRIFQKIQNIYFTIFYKFENNFAKCEMGSANSNPVLTLHLKPFRSFVKGEHFAGRDFRIQLCMERNC